MEQVDNTDNTESTDSFVDIVDNNSTHTVIVFGGLGHKVGMPIFEFKKALSPFKVNIVFFRDMTRSWYHNPIPEFGHTFQEKSKKIQTLLEPFKDTKKYLIGSSAGGFAALMFGAFIQAEGALLFGPQVFTDKPTRRLLGEKRWPRLTNNIEGHENRNICQLSGQISHPVYIIAGGSSQLDIMHALYAKAHSNAEIYLLSKGGHNVALELKNANILHNILETYLLSNDPIKEYSGLKIGNRLARLERIR